MATNNELYGLLNNSDLRNQVFIAVIKAAETIMNELGTVENHTNRLLWASGVFTNTDLETDRMFKAVLAANANSTVTQITDAEDPAIQTNVDDHVDLFATG